LLLLQSFKADQYMTILNSFQPLPFMLQIYQYDPNLFHLNASCVFCDSFFYFSYMLICKNFSSLILDFIKFNHG